MRERTRPLGLGPCMLAMAALLAGALGCKDERREGAGVAAEGLGAATPEPVGADVAQEETAAAVAEPDPEPEPAPPPMGTWLRGETLSLRIDAATYAAQLRSGAHAARPDIDHRFLRVRLTIENRGLTPIRIRAARFWLRDSENRDVPVSATHQAAFSPSSDELFLVSGMREPFEILFQIHKDTDPLWLIFSDAATRLVGGLEAKRDKQGK